MGPPRKKNKTLYIPLISPAKLPLMLDIYYIWKAAGDAKNLSCIHAKYYCQRDLPALCSRHTQFTKPLLFCEQNTHIGGNLAGPIKSIEKSFLEFHLKFLCCTRGGLWCQKYRSPPLSSPLCNISKSVVSRNIYLQNTVCITGFRRISSPSWLLGPKTTNGYISHNACAAFCMHYRKGVDTQDLLVICS